MDRALKVLQANLSPSELQQFYDAIELDASEFVEALGELVDEVLDDDSTDDVSDVQDEL